MNEYYIFKALIEQGGLTEEDWLPDHMYSLEDVKFKTFKDAVKAYLSEYDQIEKGKILNRLGIEKGKFILQLELKRFVHLEHSKDFDAEVSIEINFDPMILYTECVSEGKVASEFHYSEEELKNLIKN